MTTRQEIANAILDNYPRVCISEIHEASDYSYSCDRMLRRMKADGLEYEYKTGYFKRNEWIKFKHYDFTGTTKREIKTFL